MGKLFKFLTSLLITVLLLSCLGLAILQTPFGKDTITLWIVETGKQEGIEISIGSIEGHIPFKWEISDIHIRLNETDILDIDKAKMRISFFPLLYKRLSISYLDIHHAAYCFAEKELPENTFTAFDLPLSAKLKSFSIDKLDITNLSKELSNTFAVEGSGY
ncbi:MAG TPA: hypothetical protein VIJ46_01920, partial [Rhabdochlamydiaceae bacterium]